VVSDAKKGCKKYKRLVLETNSPSQIKVWGCSI